MITMKNIVKKYNTGGEELTVLKSVDFNVKKGEFVAVLGPSGSGKSTLMNIVGCMDLCNSGEYYLDNVAVHSLKGEKLTRIRNEKIGFIFQRYQLIPTYSALQNIIMPLLIRGMSHSEAVKHAQPTIDMLGLTERVKHRPSELSGGQQQRVAIARSLVGQPAILLADEPTGALDSKTGAEVMQLFHKLHKMGNTIVMITHDSELARNAQRVVQIVDGNIYTGHAQKQVEIAKKIIA